MIAKAVSRALPPARAGAHARETAFVFSARLSLGPVLLLLVAICALFAPAVALAPSTHTLTLCVSTYRPPLKELRRALQRAGGGSLVAIDDYRGERLYFSAAFAGRPRDPGARPASREFSYSRYRARAAAQDYLLEIEKYSGALVQPLKAPARSRFQPYWGGGASLIRMKREGAVEQRGAPPLTQKDWLTGLCGFFGTEYFFADRLSMDARYRYDLVPASTFNGIEYRLGGRSFSYALSWHL